MGTKSLKESKGSGRRYRGNKNKRVVGSKGAALKRRGKPKRRR
jgi:hypothetical protein